MKRITGVLAALFLAALIFGQSSIAGTVTLLSAGGSARAPVGGGFDPSITAVNFAMTNFVVQNNDLTASPWAVETHGAPAAPTVTTVSDTLPDGTTGNVSQVAVPAVPAGTGANDTIVKQQFAFGIVSSKTVTAGMWIKVISGAGPIWFNISTSSAVFERFSIPTTNNLWHLYTISVPPNAFNPNDTTQIQLGVNQFDSGQGAGSAATVVEATGAFVMDGTDWKLLTYANVKAGAPLATTTASVTGILNEPLPPHMLFRLASALVPDPANPTISEAPSEPWRSGGVSSPYTQNPQLQSGGFFWAMSNCTSATNHGAWLSFCLWKSADGVSGWTEDTTNAGYLKSFGSASDYSANGTGSGASNFNLKPAFLPFGCNVGGMSHPFCVLYSALNKFGNSGDLYLGWADHINDQYTMLGCSTSTPCTGQTTVPLVGMPAGYLQPNLVSIQNVGGMTGTNYIYVNMLGPTFGPITIILTTPANPATAGAGSSLTYNQRALSPITNGADWEFADGTSGYLDSDVFLNHCGYYEYWYTAINGNRAAPFNVAEQLIGTAISPNKDGPWYKYPGPFIPAASSMYGGSIFLGDSNVIEDGTHFIWNGNFDNGTNTSHAVRALAPQGVCP